MQLYRTTGSVQQEQESSPLTSKAEHTGPLSTGGSIVGTTTNLTKCIKINRSCCLHIGWIQSACWAQIKSSVMFQPTFIFLFQVAGYRQRWQEFGTKRCTDVQQSLPLPLQQRGRCAVTRQKTVRFNLKWASGPVRCAGAAGAWINTDASSFVVRQNIVEHVREAVSHK